MKECVIEDVTVIKEYVLFKIYNSPERFKKDIEYILFLEEMNTIGLIIILSLPNGIIVHLQLNPLFCIYESSSRINTLYHFEDKLINKFKRIEDNKLKMNTRKDAVNVNEMKTMNEGMRYRR